MLTLKEFKAIPFSTVFATGVIRNAPDGLYMTDSNIGEELRWVAKKGMIDDWAIYCHWAYHDAEWIRDRGDKVYSDENIKRCVPCEDEVLKLYRK